MQQRYVERQILPICRQQLTSKGGTSQLWRIAVQREFVLFDGNEEESDTEMLSNDPVYGPVSETRHAREMY